MSDSEKKGEEAIMPVPQRNSTTDSDGVKVINDDDAFEVFKRDGAGVDFRTVGWVQASVIFLKSKQPRHSRRPPGSPHGILTAGTQSSSPPAY